MDSAVNARINILYMAANVSFIQLKTSNLNPQQGFQKLMTINIRNEINFINLFWNILYIYILYGYKKFRLILFRYAKIVF